ncbi:MAG TPA: hypothetical protein QGG59_03400, partial [Planctomycetota bacterium]|nr:hypothetical protein [Planctomycetota bacterium]
MTFSLKQALGAKALSELLEMHEKWIGGLPPMERLALIDALKAKMLDPPTVAAIQATLAPNPGAAFFVLLGGPKAGLTFPKIHGGLRGSGIRSGGLRAALAELFALGFSAPVGEEDSNGNPRWVIPTELRKALGEAIPAQLNTQELLTL